MNIGIIVGAILCMVHGGFGLYGGIKRSREIGARALLIAIPSSLLVGVGFFVFLELLTRR